MQRSMMPRRARRISLCRIFRRRAHLSRFLNSPLSEAGTVGFEVGYNVQAPERLVLWEAQYGDFVNNAQTMLDEFLLAGRAKWGLTPSLVMLLPHGNEGMGPDHSSARIERFLGLAAETNVRIAYPSTAAQYFHLLRRQALLLETDPLPLIVFTPKGLLRHPLVNSPAKLLAESHWQSVIDDPELPKTRKDVENLLLCSGRIYVDLVTSDLRKDNPDDAIVRVEQLYPFPRQAIEEIVEVVSQFAERDLGAGGAAQHGRLGLHAPPPARTADPGRPAADLCRAAGEFQPG